jgi:hypothetical protein
MVVLLGLAVLPASASAFCGGGVIAQRSAVGHQTVSLPSWVTHVCVEAQGGAGGGTYTNGHGGHVEGTFELPPGQTTIDLAIGGGGGVAGGDASAAWFENATRDVLLAVAGGGGASGNYPGFDGGDAGPDGSDGVNGLTPAISGFGGTSDGDGGAGGIGDDGNSGGAGGTVGSPNSGGEGGGQLGGGGGGSAGAGGGGSTVAPTTGGSSGSGSGAGGYGAHGGGGRGGDGAPGDSEDKAGGGGGYTTDDAQEMPVFGGGGGSAQYGEGNGGGGAGYGGGGAGGYSALGLGEVGAGGGGSNYVNGDGTGILDVDSDGGNPSSTLRGTGVRPDVTLTPSSADFGDEVVGATSGPQTFTVRNAGSAGATLRTIGLSGADPADFALDSSGCMGGTVNGRLAPGASCQVSVTFTPTAGGVRRASLDVTSDGGDPSSALSGTGLQAVVTLTPTSHDFGDVPVGVTSDPQTFTVANAGSADATLRSIALSGADAADFDLDASGCMGSPVDGRLAPGASCQVSVAFTPSAIGQRSASLDVTSNGGNPSSALSGTGAGPHVTLSPSSADFGTELVGATSPSQTFTVRNVGLAGATLRAIHVSGADAADFTAATDDCMSGPLSGRLAPGASCQVSVTFTPSTSGQRTASLDVDSDGGDPSSGLSGIGVEPVVTLSPARHDFGDVLQFGSSAPTQFTVANSGTQTVTLRLVDVIGPDAADFSADSDDCLVAHGGTLRAGESCVVPVTFSPSTAGAERASLVVASDGGDPTSALSGTGTAPRLTMAPHDQNVGGVTIGSSGDARIVTVRNAGTAPTTIQSLGMLGADAADYDADTSECMVDDGGRLAPGEFCEVPVTFSPSVAGTRTASLVAVSDGGNPSSRFAGLGATLTGAAVAASPGELDFGGLQVGSSSTSQSVTIRNSGAATATITDISLTNGNTSDFAANADDCTRAHGGQLAAGESCTVHVSFSPLAAGARAAQLDVTSTGGSPTVALTGSGIG